MIGALHVPGDSLLHRAGTATKLLALLLLGIVVFLPLPLTALAVLMVACAGMLGSTGLPPGEMFRRLRWPLLLIALLMGVNWAFEGVDHALRVTLRLVGLLLAATAVSATTRGSALIAALERALMPLERMGLVNAGQVSLTIGLALRFVPLIAAQAQEIREAQAARGLDRQPVALVLPLVLRSLRGADEIADAIDARGFPPP